MYVTCIRASQVALVDFLWFEPPGKPSSKEFTYTAGDTGDAGSIPRLGISPGVGNGNPLQYSCLETHMDRGAWQAADHHGVAKSQTRLSNSTHMWLVLYFYFAMLPWRNGLRWLVDAG